MTRSWATRSLLDRKPIPVVAVALANKKARGVWAMLMRGESYRGPVLIGAWRPARMGYRVVRKA